MAIDASTQHTGHPILSMIFFIIASISGAVGMNYEAMTMEDLKFYDMVLAIVLKGVSILSFIIVIALNVGKLKEKLKTWFPNKKK